MARRTRKCCFTSMARSSPTFEANLTPPIPPIPCAAGRGAQPARARPGERSRFFQNLLAETLGDRMPRFVAIVAGGIVTFLVLLTGAKKFMEGRHHYETAVPQVARRAACAERKRSEQRAYAILQKGRFRAAVASARRRLAAAGVRASRRRRCAIPSRGIHLVALAPATAGDFVLHLARNAGVAPRSRKQFFALVESLKGLTAAAKDGRLALLVDGKNVRHRDRSRGGADEERGDAACCLPMCVIELAVATPVIWVLKPHEANLSPPGISVFIGGTPEKAASDWRAVFSRPGASAKAATVGTAGIHRIRELGLDVIAWPTPNFPDHGRLSHGTEDAAGFTPENLQKIIPALCECNRALVIRIETSEVARKMIAKFKDPGACRENSPNRCLHAWVQRLLGRSDQRFVSLGKPQVMVRDDNGYRRRRRFG